MYCVLRTVYVELEGFLPCGSGVASGSKVLIERVQRLAVTYVKGYRRLSPMCGSLPSLSVPFDRPYHSTVYLGETSVGKGAVGAVSGGTTNNYGVCVLSPDTPRVDCMTSTGLILSRVSLAFRPSPFALSPFGLQIACAALISPSQAH